MPHDTIQIFFITRQLNLPTKQDINGKRGGEKGSTRLNKVRSCRVFVFRLYSNAKM